MNHRPVPLHVAASGTGDDVVVLLHGLGSSHADMAAQIDALSQRYRVLAADLRGHGRSPAAVPGVTIEALAADVAAALRARAFSRVAVVGWSLGGLVAAVLAAECPELVSKLVLVNAPPSLRPQSLRERWMLAQRRFATRWLPLSVLGSFIGSRLFVTAEAEDLRRTFEARFRENDPASYRAVFNAICRHDDRGVLEAVRCPTLVLSGDQDYWPLSAKRAQCTRLAQGRLAVVEQSGHAAPIEHPDEVNRILLGFLDEAEQSVTRPRGIADVAALVLLLSHIACGCAEAPEGTRGGAETDASPPISVSSSPEAAPGDDPAAPPPERTRPHGDAAPPEPLPDGDGGLAPLGAPTDPPAGSRCTVTETTVFCEHNVTSFTAETVTRDVYWQTPLGAPPPGGFPVVLVYQGSLFGPAITWGELTAGLPFGGFHQGRLQAMLLDGGYTVIAPSAAGGAAWQTNTGVPYESTTDHIFITALLEAIEAGDFGPADPARMYATGISSGGYMASRMAVSYPGAFRGLAIQSGSYATCLGPICNVPSTLPDDHPPTLLLHGAADLTVPLSTAERYHDVLVTEGVPTELVVDPVAGHEWLADSPERITAWFDALRGG